MLRGAYVPVLLLATQACAFVPTSTKLPSIRSAQQQRRAVSMMSSPADLAGLGTSLSTINLAETGVADDPFLIARSPAPRPA